MDSCRQASAEPPRLFYTTMHALSGRTVRDVRLLVSSDRSSRCRRHFVATKKDSYSFTSSNGQERGRTSVQAALDPRRPPASPVTVTTPARSEVSALTVATDYGFGFSAGGLVFPYFLGVTTQLQAMNVLRPETPVAGASAGSIAAVCAKSGLSEGELLDAFLDLARDCRQGGTRARLKSVLKRVLQEALPQDIHQRCEGRVFLAVTKLWPQFEPQTVSSFRSREDVIDTLLTSSHIPLWFDGNLYTSYRDGIYFDGGITDFIPATPTERCHRVCCFPASQMRLFKNIDLSPDTYEAWPYDMRTMLSWAFEPAAEETLLLLVEKGKRDARSWALANVPASQRVLV